MSPAETYWRVVKSENPLRVEAISWKNSLIEDDAENQPTFACKLTHKNKVVAFGTLNISHNGTGSLAIPLTPGINAPDTPVNGFTKKIVTKNKVLLNQGIKIHGGNAASIMGLNFGREYGSQYASVKVSSKGDVQTGYELSLSSRKSDLVKNVNPPPDSSIQEIALAVATDIGASLPGDYKLIPIRPDF